MGEGEIFKNSRTLAPPRPKAKLRQGNALLIPPLDPPTPGPGWYGQGIALPELGLQPRGDVNNDNVNQ